MFVQPAALVPVTVYDAFDDGLTIAEPPVYTYVDAPDGLIVNEEPLQIEPEVTATVGLALTVTVETAEFEHPAELVPVTVYDAFELGLTIAEPPVYTYVDAPDGIIVNEDPLQIEPEFTTTVGIVLTVTVETAVFEHPATLVPVTV